MPREVERQSERFATGPHAPRLHELPDSAYHTESYRNEPGPGREYNPNMRHYEPSDHDERAHEMAMDDEDSGYNWGPPPTSGYDPHEHEHEVDPYPYA